MPVNSNRITNYGQNAKGVLYFLEETSSESSSVALEFQFNPTEITESRSVEYNFSEAQGQVLPHAQFGRVGNTEISFTLKFFKHTGVTEELKKVRLLTLPKKLTRLSYYDQVSPHIYWLSLDQYFSGYIVVTSLNIVVKQYARFSFDPIHFDVDMTFTEVQTLTRTTPSIGG